MLDQLINEACSSTLSKPSIELNNEVISEIMSKPTMPKEAAKMIKKKLNTNSPKVSFLALILTDMCMQKCGFAFH